MDRYTKPVKSPTKHNIMMVIAMRNLVLPNDISKIKITYSLPYVFSSVIQTLRKLLIPLFNKDRYTYSQ